MTLWCHCWGCKQPHSASHIHNTCIWSVWAPSYAVERHLGAPLHSYDGAGGGPNFGKLGSGGAKMTLWCHCWGCKQPHSASHIHNTCIWSVLAPSYAVERHLGAPLHSYNGAGGGQNFENWGQAEQKRRCGIIVEAVNNPTLHHTSTIHAYEVFEHLYMLWKGIWVHPYTVITVEGGGQNLENWGQAELKQHCFDFV